MGDLLVAFPLVAEQQSCQRGRAYVYFEEEPGGNQRQAAYGPPAANATLLMQTRTVLGERSMSRAR